MEKFKNSIELAPGIELGGEQLVLIAGPCAAESFEICYEVGSKVKEMCERLGIAYIFKASYDKANRTSASSYRGKGMNEGLEILKQIKEKLQVPVLTDVHESHQVEEVAQVADILQIPAFLCRQTDLLLAAGESGKAVNIKRGQFMAPEDMQYAVRKIEATGNSKAFLTERGVSFGYHNLVVDMRGLPIMRQYSPVVFDVTHSVQQPGGAGGSSGGQREFAPFLARAAAAAGVDGFFIETHPNPSEALSDGPNMVPLHEIESFLEMLLDVWKTGKKYS
jgi:2-dehydro-3-deoxyphosphooctonate aldolase (KDO 8-P synthase)